MSVSDLGGLRSSLNQYSGRPKFVSCMHAKFLTSDGKWIDGTPNP